MLRDMSVLSYRGKHTWPSVWLSKGKGKGKRVRGEVGVLKDVCISVADPKKRGAGRSPNLIYLSIDFNDFRYVGRLVMEDPDACRQIGTVLSALRGWSIKQIGDTDLEHLL